MRLLFVKERLSWPRSSGHDVHTYYSMQALVKLGHTVGLVTLHELDAQAIDKSGVSNLWCLKTDHQFEKTNADKLSLSKSQEKFRNYWGIDKGNILRIGQIAKEFDADAVIVVGLNVLPYLGAVDQALRIWYAGDEWVWHHASQVRLWDVGSWRELKEAAIKGLYERAYAPLLDRVWMVSQSDERAIRWVAGIKAVDVLPNGVDTDYYQPIDVIEEPRTCTFWGRLDFGPNIQALEWFCKKVWPLVRRDCGDARFTIYGFQPTPAVERLVEQKAGIQLIGNLPDIRQEIARHQVVVLPFVSGGGIKNKLLEASAMGKAIICTPRTSKGLSSHTSVLTATHARDWVAHLQKLWNEPDRRQQLGKDARGWVVKDHTWEAVAKLATDGLEASKAHKAAG